MKERIFLFSLLIILVVTLLGCNYNSTNKANELVFIPCYTYMAIPNEENQVTVEFYYFVDKNNKNEFKNDISFNLLNVDKLDSIEYEVIKGEGTKKKDIYTLRLSFNLENTEGVINSKYLVANNGEIESQYYIGNIIIDRRFNNNENLKMGVAKTHTAVSSSPYKYNLSLKILDNDIKDISFICGLTDKYIFNKDNSNIKTEDNHIEGVLELDYDDELLAFIKPVIRYNTNDKEEYYFMQHSYLGFLNVTDETYEKAVNLQKEKRNN